MTWLILLLVSAVLTSFGLYIDNFTIDVYFKGNGANAQKVFYAFFQGLLFLILLPIFGVDFNTVTPNTLVLFVVCGFASSMANVFYYKALEVDDATNVSIFVQLSPILYLLFGWLFFGEFISPSQILAFFLIMAAPFIIILTTRKRSRKIRLRAVFYVFLYVCILVGSNLVFVKQSSPEASFGTELSFMFLGRSLGNFVLILTNRKWIKRFHTVVKSTHGKVFLPLIANGTLGTIKKFCYYFALTIAPNLALASAVSDSTTPTVVFFLGLILTAIRPAFGREKLNKKAITVHAITTALVIAGIILIQN